MFLTWFWTDLDIRWSNLGVRFGRFARSWRVFDHGFGQISVYIGAIWVTVFGEVSKVVADRRFRGPESDRTLSEGMAPTDGSPE